MEIIEKERLADGSRDGTFDSGECATAEETIIKADAQGRRKRFLGN